LIFRSSVHGFCQMAGMSQLREQDLILSGRLRP